MPKEMLPIVDKPVIQYVVEELVDAGIKEMNGVVANLRNDFEDVLRQNEILVALMRNNPNPQGSRLDKRWAVTLKTVSI